MLKYLIIKSGKNLPPYVFENAFKSGKIHLVSKERLNAAKPIIEKLYPDIKPYLLQHLDSYIIAMQDIIEKDHYLLTSLCKYKKDSSFENLFNIIYNHELSLSNIKNYSKAGKATHTFYKNVVQNMPDEVFEKIIKNLF